MNLRDLLPKRPRMDDGELNAWLMDHGGRGREALIYRKIRIRDPLTGTAEPAIRCTCSVCEESWDTKDCGYSGSYPMFLDYYAGIKSNGSYTSCPACGAELETAYYTRLKRHPIRSTLYPWEIVKKDGCIMFICWAVIHEIDDEGSYLYPECRNAYILDPEGKWHRFTAMERSGWSSMSKMEYTGHWYEMDRFQVNDGKFWYRLPHEENVYEGTQLENGKLEILERVDPKADLLTYARIYIRHRNVENITMNTPRLMAAMLRDAWGVKDIEWINFKSRKPHEMVYLPKPEYMATEDLTDTKLQMVITRLRAVAACRLWEAPDAYAEKLGHYGIIFAKNNAKNKMLRRWGLEALWNYISRQAPVVAGNCANSLEQSMILCEDYWKDMVAAGFDVNSRAAFFPRDVRQAHAGAIMAIKYEENEKLRKQFEAQAEKLEPLNWKYMGMIIRPAQSEAELVAEGKILNHCVARYADAHCRGESIFFIRREETPDMPWFTLQLNTKTGTVMQNRGKTNCSRTPEVMTFEKAWLDQVVIPWLQEQKEKKNREEKAA